MNTLERVKEIEGERGREIESERGGHVKSETDRESGAQQQMKQKGTEDREKNSDKQKEAEKMGKKEWVVKEAKTDLRTSSL